MNINLQGGFSSAEEIKFTLTNIQEAVSCNIPLLNSDVIALLKVDLILRRHLKETNNHAWNNTYFNGNLFGFPGENIIKKTENYLEHLIAQGSEKPFNGGDYALRNPKHLFDHITGNLPPDIFNEIKHVLRSSIQQRDKNAYRKNEGGALMPGQCA